MGGVGVRRRVAAHCHLSAFQCSQTGLARCGHLYVQIGQAASALKNRNKNKNGNENENIDRNSCQIGRKSEKIKMKKIVKKIHQNGIDERTMTVIRRNLNRITSNTKCKNQIIVWRLLTQ